jgi:hypothetical protein
MRSEIILSCILLVVWSEDNSKKLIICCHVLGGTDKDDDGIGTIEEDIFCVNGRIQ